MTIWTAFADDKPRGDIERGKQRGCTMPHIAVRAPLRHARHHWQDRLLAIKRLDLAFLINAEDKGTVRRGPVKAAAIAPPVDRPPDPPPPGCLAHLPLPPASPPPP